MGQAMLTNIGSIDETEEVDERNSGEDEQVNLAAQAAFCCWIEFDQRSSILISGCEALTSGFGGILSEDVFLVVGDAFLRSH